MREKESSNGGGKGKDGGEGRKVNSAAPSVHQLSQRYVVCAFWEGYKGCASEGWKGRKEER